MLKIDCHFSGSSNIVKAVYDEMLQAKNVVFVAMYTLTDETLINGLIELRQKGVKILAIFDDEQIKNFNDPIIRLTNADIDWRTSGSKGSSMHNKFIIIDGVKIITGSFNWTRRASKNKENVVFIEDHRTSLIFLDGFNSIWESITSKHYKEKLGPDRYDKLQTELSMQEQGELNLLEKIQKLELLGEDHNKQKNQIESLKEDRNKQKKQIEGLKEDHNKQIEGLKEDHNKQKKQIEDQKISNENLKKIIKDLKIENKTLLDGAKYVGQLKDGVPHGQEIVLLPDGTVYKGEIEDGEPHGHGTEVRPDGEEYEGEFCDGTRHGQGTLTLPDGTIYKGEFEDGEPHGHGTEVRPDGEEYEGEFYKGFSC